MMNRKAAAVFCLPLSFVLLASCTYHKVETESKVELAPVEVKPIHIVLDINIKIQEELKKKFGEKDEIARSISDQEAEEALKRYLEGK